MLVWSRTNKWQKLKWSLLVIINVIHVMSASERYRM